MALNRKAEGRSNHPRRWERIALIGCIAVIAAACGARVPPYVGASTAGGQQAGGGSNGSAENPSALGSAATVPGTKSGGSGGGTLTTTLGSGPSSGGGGGGQTGTAGSGGGTGNGGSSGGSGGTGGSQAGSVASMTPATFSFNPAQQAAYCTGTTGNKSTGPGVSAGTITVGNVSGISGLIDSFKPGYQAVTAAFDAVNRYGGICGRQLKLSVEDDQQSSSNNAADVQALIPNVLAFVGSLSDADNGGVPAMVAAGTPDMGSAINTNRSNSSVYWSGTGGSVTVRNGQAYIYNTWLNGLKAYHDMPSSIAVVSYSIAISQQAGEEYATAFKDAGVNICYTAYNLQAGAQSTQMNSVAQGIKSAHCGGVFTTMDVVGNANLLDDLYNDQVPLQLVSTTYEGYDPTQIATAGQQEAQGLQVALNSVPLTDPNPGVQLYQSELGTYEPGKSTTEFGLESWSDAELFIYALLKAGRNPTRASLTAALAQVTGWTTDGAFGPYSPRDRTGPVCTDDVEVKGSTFVREWPTSGLYCNGQLIDVGAAS